MANLYIIATPIGNLEDFSFRALRILKDQVKTLYCEDTRITMRLLAHYKIEDKKLISLNKFNEEQKSKEIINRLDLGQDLAIVSDAGSPLISDPGSPLMQIVYQTEHKVIPIPGPSALTSALSVCPLDIGRFVFEGFLPHGPKQRRRILRHLLSEERAIVFFESPHRLLKSLEDMINIFGAERRIFIARELTKKFEQLYFASLQEAQSQLQSQFPDQVQGEFVLVLEAMQSLN